MLTSSGGRSNSMLKGGRGGKIRQNLADVICERSHTVSKIYEKLILKFLELMCNDSLFELQYRFRPG